MLRAQPRPVRKHRQDHPLHRETLGSRLLGKASRAESHASGARVSGARTGTQTCPLRGPPGRGCSTLHSYHKSLFSLSQAQFLSSLCPMLEAHLVGSDSFHGESNEAHIFGKSQLEFQTGKEGRKVVPKSSLLHGTLSSPPSTGIFPKNTHTPAREGLGPCLSMPCILHSLSSYLPHNSCVPSLSISQSHLWQGSLQDGVSVNVNGLLSTVLTKASARVHFFNWEQIL